MKRYNLLTQTTSFTPRIIFPMLPAFSHRNDHKLQKRKESVA